MPESNPADLRDFLSRTSFFGGLGPEVTERIISVLREKHVPAGTTLFAEGDNGKSMYIVRSGSLIVKRRGPAGHDVRLLLMRPGDFVGVTTLIEMEPRPFSAVTERDSVLLELTNMDLYGLYKEDLKAYVLVLQNITRELCRRLRKAGRRICELEDSVLLDATGHPATVGKVDSTGIAATLPE